MLIDIENQLVELYCDHNLKQIFNETSKKNILNIKTCQCEKWFFMTLNLNGQKINRYQTKLNQGSYYKPCAPKYTAL